MKLIQPEKFEKSSAKDFERVDQLKLDQPGQFFWLHQCWRFAPKITGNVVIASCNRRAFVVRSSINLRSPRFFGAFFQKPKGSTLQPQRLEANKRHEIKAFEADPSKFTTSINRPKKWLCLLFTFLNEQLSTQVSKGF